VKRTFVVVVIGLALAGCTQRPATPAPVTVTATPATVTVTATPATVTVTVTATPATVVKTAPPAITPDAAIAQCNVQTTQEIGDWQQQFQTEPWDEAWGRCMDALGVYGVTEHGYTS
jgi:PBP1b-binding outer membrane lipoprotein LpoB